MWELDYKESWVVKNWCFWTVVLEKTLESPLDCKEIQPVHPKGDQSWIFIERPDAEAETPILWPPDVKKWLIGKDSDAGKDWRQEEKGTMENKMVGWHHRLDGPEFEQAPGVGDGQGSLACCSPWGHKELDMTEWLNWTEATLMCMPSKWSFKTSSTDPFPTDLQVPDSPAQKLQGPPVWTSNHLVSQSLGPSHLPHTLANTCPSSQLSRFTHKPKNTGEGSLSLLQRRNHTRNHTEVSCIAGGFFTSWTIR